MTVKDDFGSVQESCIEHYTMVTSNEKQIGMASTWMRVNNYLYHPYYLSMYWLCTKQRLLIILIMNVANFISDGSRCYI